MGKIVAIGGGRYDDGEIVNIFEYIVGLSKKKNPLVVFLPTAGFDDMDGDEPIGETFVKLGCEFKPLLLTDETLTAEQIRGTILGADIIYAGGGNLEFLMNIWKKTGTDKVLIEAYEKGIVLSGYSSGAMCWFKSGYDDCGENHSFVFVDCLAILPFCNCPHFEGGNWKSFADAIKTRDISGIAADDGAALVYDNGTYSTLQGNDGGEVFLFDSENAFERINLTEDISILNNEKFSSKL